jgi:hypothetical protein
LAATLAERLCASHHLAIDEEALKSNESLALITELANQGSVAFQVHD